MKSVVEPVSRSRNRRGEGVRLRADLVRAATAIVDETGTTSTVTLRSVARRAGVAAPSIYPHFANPQAILLAAVTEEFGRLREHLRSAVDAAGADPVDRLLAACAAYLGYAEERPARYLLLFGGAWDAGRAVVESAVDAEDVAGLGLEVLEDLVGWFTACVEDGRSTSTAPRTDALALWLGLHGLAQQRIVSSGLRWPPDLADRLVARLACLRAS